MSDELAAVSRVTCHAAAVMCNVAPLGAAQWAAVDRRPHGVSIAAHCALLIVSPHTHTRTSTDRWLQPGSTNIRWWRQSKKLNYCISIWIPSIRTGMNRTVLNLVFIKTPREKFLGYSSCI